MEDHQVVTASPARFGFALEYVSDVENAKRFFVELAAARPSRAVA
jgi:hypothetical protein